MRLLIVLLFTLFVSSISWAAEADTVVLVADVSAVDVQRRELVVSPVFAGMVKTGETLSAGATVRVKLVLDHGADKAFEAVLPACVFVGNRVKLRGGYRDDSLFMAETVRGCSTRNYSDKTGVRSRLNRVNGACSAR